MISMARLALSAWTVACTMRFAGAKEIEGDTRIARRSLAPSEPVAHASAIAAKHRTFIRCRRASGGPQSAAPAVCRIDASVGAHWLYSFWCDSLARQIR